MATWSLDFTTPRGNELEIRRGDTLNITVLKLGDISNARVELWFTVKDAKDDADTTSWIQISETVGLEYINSVPATVPGNGTIAVTDAVAGDLTIELAAVETAKLTDIGRLYADVQVLDADGVRTLVQGRAVIIGDTTRDVA